MKHIACISFTTSSLNFDHRIKFMGEDLRVSRFGVDFNSELMNHMIDSLDGVADVIALQGIHPEFRMSGKTFRHYESESFKSRVKHSRLVTGDLLRAVYMPWALRYFARENEGFFVGKRIAFYSGLLDRVLIDCISQYSERLYFYDPLLHLGIGQAITSVSGLENYVKLVAPFMQRVPLSIGLGSGENRKKMSGADNIDIFVARSSVIERFSFEHFSGKTLIVDSLTPSLERQLHEVGIANILSFQPQIKELELIPNLSFAIIEGVFQALTKGWQPLDEDTILQFIDELSLRPTYKKVSKPIKKDKLRRFAFIVHPLSMADLFRHPSLRPFKPLTEVMEGVLEKGAALLPSVQYGKITGIKSIESGVETEGTIYSIFDTPKMMLKKPAEETYNRLIKVCELAARDGAEIIGLGAYTKIVGDAGVTVAKHSPIPVTTGNSLSAAATLWAAREASAKLGFVPPYKSGVTLEGKAMVIGATGSIGAVCAKMLASVVQDLTLCSRTPDRLLDLKDEILKISPKCRVHVVTNPNLTARKMDLIVTSTSSFDKRVLDIMSVKPGCVICDVSRPLDIKEEDALKRPDVLVIESGEIQLPGDTHMTCDIGTPESVVYACLAETALLSLEGLLESYTLSRHINYEKVRHIYDLAKKHGAKLAHIRGHAGNISDSEIDLCREHATKALETWNYEEA